MLHRGSRLQGAVVRGTDGDVGKVERLYFDDRQWTISHLAVHPDEAPADRSVLISPSSIRRNWNVATLPATLTRDDVRDCPQDGDITVDGAHERNVEDIKGFHIQATDGEIGHVDDVLIDEDSWRVRYLLIDTSNWIGGKWVAISPSVLRGIDWEHGKLEVGVTRDTVKQGPELDSMPVPSAETMPPFVLL
jgi:sporulation protein YlmC with PRC-barrel domain